MYLIRERNSISVKSNKIIHAGGLKERISHNSVKLACSGQHTSLTNPGYSRQSGDGNYFYY